MNSTVEAHSRYAQRSSISKSAILVTLRPGSPCRSLRLRCLFALRRRAPCHGLERQGHVLAAFLLYREPEDAAHCLAEHFADIDLREATAYLQSKPAEWTLACLARLLADGRDITHKQVCEILLSPTIVPSSLMVVAFMHH